MGEELLRASIFGDFAPDIVAAVAAHLEPVSFPRRHTVFHEGDTGDRLYVIATGKVKVTQMLRGRDRVIELLGPRDVFGELWVYGPGLRLRTVTTLTSLQGVTLTASALQSCIAAYPEITEQLFRVLASRPRHGHDVLGETGTTAVAGRVATLLLDLANRFGGPEDGAMRIYHELNYKELGQLAGTTCESMNRVLSAFAEEGCIRLHGRAIDVCDAAALADHAT